MQSSTSDVSADPFTREPSGPTRRAFLRGVTASVAVGSAVGGSAQSAAAQEDGGGTTHTVNMTDELVFDPDDITIAPGDTIRWVNVGGVGHSVTAYEEEIPSDAAYFASGGFDSESAARGGYPQQGDIAGGEEYSHTFEVEGDYEYFCIPHETVGMLGAVSVVPGGAQPETGVELPTVPDSAKSLAIATMTAMLSVVGLAYFFLKYGGDYGERDAGGDSQPGRR
jgi:plastocyanin